MLEGGYLVAIGGVNDRVVGTVGDDHRLPGAQVADEEPAELGFKVEFAGRFRVTLEAARRPGIGKDQHVVEGGPVLVGVQLVDREKLGRDGLGIDIGVGGSDIQPGQGRVEGQDPFHPEGTGLAGVADAARPGRLGLEGHAHEVVGRGPARLTAARVQPFVDAVLLLQGRGRGKVDEITAALEVDNLGHPAATLRNRDHLQDRVRNFDGGQAVEDRTPVSSPGHRRPGSAGGLAGQAGR
ncbi:MAG: hypothetical protein BWY73_00838 [candidate division TA06 bacterium ADurb.Bin417]|uniref:Uncharacterized protein n=1 Tax=candidate division TA06 bacterium ADurb.Bin417 TaxID=1852828 RepID=A0A1V5MGK7_UNCT6|nr:MAG: hypothetical protein BWY73_00838 [candidate division TA06 bacterium ADurb.Bin417]